MTESNRIKYKRQLTDDLEKEVITFFYKFETFLIRINHNKIQLKKHGRTTKYRIQTIVA